MGTLDNKFGNYAGLCSAALFIVAAFVMLLTKADVETGLTFYSKAILTIAGIFVLVTGILMFKGEGEKERKMDAGLFVLLGLVAALTYGLIFLSVEDMTMIGIVGIVALIAMLGCTMCDSKKGNKLMMYFDIVMAVLELIMVALIFAKVNPTVAMAAAIMVLGIWMAVYMGIAREYVEAEPAIDPTRKSAKKARKQRAKQEEEARKTQERHDKLEMKAKKDKKKAEQEKKKEEQAKKHEKPKAEPKPSPASEKAEPAKEEKPAEEPKAQPAEEPKAEPAEVKEEPKKEEKPKTNNDFMSKLVSSKDASSKAASAPVAKVEEEPAAEPKPEPTPEHVPESEHVEEEPAEEPANEGEEEMEDIYTDYSPEALVRRAAWNKGLRCRRDYGDYKIPVAFVKGKVAVYVEEPGSGDAAVEAKLKEEGWEVLRFDINKVTDGLEEGAQIAEAVKANLRTQKASKKKKKPAKK